MIRPVATMPSRGGGAYLATLLIVLPHLVGDLLSRLSLPLCLPHMAHLKPSLVWHRKRSRADTPEGNVAGHSQVHQKIVSDLQRLVGHQAAEIERLKSEKAAIESSVAGLKSAHHKADNENRILKKAVTIQQERQINASTELEAARKFKAEAEERIRMLEQMNLTLQYHLQAQQSSTMNTFNQFGPRPPDVF